MKGRRTWLAMNLPVREVCAPGKKAPKFVLVDQLLAI